MERSCTKHVLAVSSRSCVFAEVFLERCVPRNGSGRVSCATSRSPRQKVRDTRRCLYSLPRRPTKGLSAMTNSLVNRRLFNHASLVSLLAAGAGTALNDTISAQQATPTRRDVIRQELPGEPPRDISLIEVTYPAGNRFPTASSCQWRRGIRPVREHRLKGRRWSRADVPCRRCLVGTSRCAIYVAPRSATRAGSPARSSSHCARPDGSLE
jgi:hypothetical protein